MFLKALVRQAMLEKKFITKQDNFTTTRICKKNFFFWKKKIANGFNQKLIKTEFKVAKIALTAIE